jgi:hypothetical protein
MHIPLSICLYLAVSLCMCICVCNHRSPRVVESLPPPLCRPRGQKGSGLAIRRSCFQVKTVFVTENSRYEISGQRSNDLPSVNTFHESKLCGRSQTRSFASANADNIWIWICDVRYTEKTVQNWPCVGVGIVHWLLCFGITSRPEKQHITKQGKLMVRTFIKNGMTFPVNYQRVLCS